MSGWSEVKTSAVRRIDESAALMAEMSETIFEWAEPGLREYRSAWLLVDYLSEKGFRVEEGVAGMPTAFTAEWGEVDPVLGFFAEYDATPGHSQRAVPYEDPAVRHGPGFTDAHNMIGVASCVAAVALSDAVSELGLEAHIRLFGTPAEKLCVGKPSWPGTASSTAWTPSSPGTLGAQPLSWGRYGPSPTGARSTASGWRRRRAGRAAT